MYKKIAQHPGTRKLYGDKLVAQGVLPAEGPDEMVKGFRAAMDEGQPHRRSGADQLQEQVRGRLGAVPRQEVDRRRRHRAAAGRDQAAGRDASRRCPSNFKVHPLVEKVIADRAAMGRGEINVDWGMGETLAYASLVASGYRGAPVGRGQRPRHLHPPPRGAARPEPREVGHRHLHAAGERRRQARRRSSSSTRSCRKRRCSASNTATRRPSRTR